MEVDWPKAHSMQIAVNAHSVWTQTMPINSLTMRITFIVWTHLYTYTQLTHTTHTQLAHTHIHDDKGLGLIYYILTHVMIKDMVNVLHTMIKGKNNLLQYSYSMIKDSGYSIQWYYSLSTITLQSYRWYSRCDYSTTSLLLWLGCVHIISVTMTTLSL